MSTMKRTTIQMYGITPRKISLIVTCGGATPFR